MKTSWKYTENTMPKKKKKISKRQTTVDKTKLKAKHSTKQLKRWMISGASESRYKPSEKSNSEVHFRRKDNK